MKVLQYFYCLNIITIINFEPGEYSGYNLRYHLGAGQQPKVENKLKSSTE